MPDHHPRSLDPRFPSLMLVAGEASGDLHGSLLARALRALAPSWQLTGMGGERMSEAGVALLADVTAQAVVGGSEALNRLPALYRAYRVLSQALSEIRPRALIVIDFPEFNMRLARIAKRHGIPVVYFIPPQIWAWRRGRIRQIARLVAKVLAVLPFEARLYEAAGIPVEFVGHPLMDILPLDMDRSEARRRLGIGDGDTLIGLLPGSRREEVGRLLPQMLDAAERISRERPGARFLLALAPTVDRSLVETEAGGRQTNLAMFSGKTYEIMAASDLLMIASGTATLEAACFGTPMIVCYRVSPLSGLLGRLLIRIPWVSLANIVAGRALVPELLQGDATGSRLAEEAHGLLRDPSRCQSQRQGLREVRARLGPSGVGERAARSVLRAAGGSVDPMMRAGGAASVA